VVHHGHAPSDRTLPRWRCERCHCCHAPAAFLPPVQNIARSAPRLSPNGGSRGGLKKSRALNPLARPTLEHRSIDFHCTFFQCPTAPSASSEIRRSSRAKLWTDVSHGGGDAIDPGCVKTHTSVKCKKYNSPTWDPAMLAQYDLTLMMRNFFEIFYARNER